MLLRLLQFRLIMEKLPIDNGLNVEAQKLSEYLLNSAHPIGGGKATWFLKQGFLQQNMEVLSEALKKHARTKSVVKVDVNNFGKKFQIECSLDSPNGETKCILSVWIVEGEQSPRLVTVYPKK